MQDREPQVGREGRVRITQDDGTIIEGVLEMADNATIQGTPYNKATQLSDAVAQALKLTPVEEATVNDALGLLPGLISDLNNVQLAMLTVETGTYTGNGKSGSANPNSITFSFVPDVVFIINSSATGTNDTYQATLFPKTSATQRSDYLVTSGSNSNSVFGYTLSVSMNGNTLEWYSSSADRQLNESGDNYDWYAIGQKFDNTVTVSCKNSSGQLQDGCVVTLGENDPVVSNSTEPLVFKTVSSAPVLTVVSPLDYSGEVQTQTLDLSNTQNLSVDVAINTDTHLATGLITASMVGAFSSQVSSVDMFCLGGGANGAGSGLDYANYAGGGFAGGGSGGGGALKNAIQTTGKMFSLIVGGRSSKSSVSADGTVFCEATGASSALTENGIKYDAGYLGSKAGTGTIGDTFMTGDQVPLFRFARQISSGGSKVTITADRDKSTVGNVIDPFTGEKLSGCGGTKFGCVYYTNYSWDPNAGSYSGTPGGGVNPAGNRVYSDSEYDFVGDAATTYGSGGAGATAWYDTNDYSPSYVTLTGGSAKPGYIRWRVTPA